MTDRSTPVVVVGAGLGGSAAAAFLAHAGVDIVLLERHPEPANRPRAWIVSPRTLELLRPLGVDGRVVEQGSAEPWTMVQTDLLLNATAGAPPQDEALAVSPSGSATCDQDLLEGILRDFATTQGATVRWDTTVTDIVDHGDLVQVRTHDGRDLTARFVIVAEGARAELLSSVGITTTVPEHGEPDPRQAFDGVLFRSAELDDLMRAVPGNAFVCSATQSIVFRRNLGRWQVQRQGERIGDAEQHIAATVGRQIAVEVLDHSHWTPSARAADNYRAGNVFLVGDAAHSFPPSLGMGGNLAVADAYDLAWKLRWVLTGAAGTDLLDSYDAERRPIGRFVMQASIDRARGDGTLDLLTAQLGLGYPAARSRALLDDGEDVTVSDPHERTPLVGARLPHSRLGDGRSTVDLTAIDTFAAVGARDAEGLPVPYARIPSVPDGGDADAVWLIRPDGHVGAHVRPERIADAVDEITGRR